MTSNFSPWHALFLVVIPLGILLAVFSENILAFANQSLGVNIRIGDIAIAYIMICLVASRYAYSASRKEQKQNLESDT